MSKKSLLKKTPPSSGTSAAKTKGPPPKSTYMWGESFTNPYLGNKLTEVLDGEGVRIGFIWTLTNGKVVVSPHLGYYIWYGEKGENWTSDSGALWLLRHRK